MMVLTIYAHHNPRSLCHALRCTARRWSVPNPAACASV
jgi:putative NADPH-quinone reductase